MWPGRTYCVGARFADAADGVLSSSASRRSAVAGTDSNVADGRLANVAILPLSVFFGVSLGVPPASPPFHIAKLGCESASFQ